MHRLIPILLTVAATAHAQPAVAPATSPATSPSTSPANSKLIEFPNIVVDRAARQVRVRCEALALPDAPLEFFCVANGGPEHEAVLRTTAKPSHIHAGLLMLGLEPGSSIRYDEKVNAWSPPHGPGVRIFVEWTRADGKLAREPAERLMRSIKDGRPMPTTTFLFTGSQQRADGAYIADLSGYIVSICNFEYTPIDVPRLVSSSNETLEWQTDLEHGPARGTAVTMILEPADPATTQSVGTTTRAATPQDAQLAELRLRRQTLLDETARVDRSIAQIEQTRDAASTTRPTKN